MANEDAALPISTLSLLAPPMRLVSAAMWKVMLQRDVMHYGKLEQFVTSLCQTVPGLLGYRHQVKLTLGLRARMILELCRGTEQPEQKVVLAQLDTIPGIIPLNNGKQRKDLKVEMTVRNFQTLVQSLLGDPEQRRLFFQEDFPDQYGPEFDKAMEKLLWEFLIRLDQLLPVPDLKQTVSWMSSAPAVLEWCAESASQPKLLRSLLQHEKCLGHLDSAASLLPSTGDSILSSLSLPPSGRVKQSNQSQSNLTSNRTTTPVKSFSRTSDRLTRRVSSPIAPVIGLISTKDLPHSTSDGNQETFPCRESDFVTPVVQNDSNIRLRSHLRPMQKSVEEVDRTKESRRANERQPTDEKDTFIRKFRARERRASKASEKEHKTVDIMDTKKMDGEVAIEHSGYIKKLGEGCDLSDLIASCMKRQIRVVIPRVDVSDMNLRELRSARDQKTVENSLPEATSETLSTKKKGRMLARKRKLSTCSLSSDYMLSDMAEKENCGGSLCFSQVNFMWQDSPGKVSLFGEDIITDSEDEATKNFKRKLFMKQYCKTKHNTYVPTLQEFWKPGVHEQPLHPNASRKR
ncbi:TERF1-interacting nuclear factor 2 [Denticeps clupeoides]|uniref:TERF1-interacting nuclear factor 2 N-terminal domain-containing protein n=1 Tax=Denticeps clupeoides TaxID=299321 RepID=A0AAY4BRW6_9TELE|nr:TERF1-interacting nuclear factor 2 [Denticeps clupeoides]